MVKGAKGTFRRAAHAARASLGASLGASLWASCAWVFAMLVASGDVASALPESPPAFAPSPLTPLAEIVTAEVNEHELKLRIRATLVEPVVATGAKPMMPPYWNRPELEGAVSRYTPYLLDHVHVLSRMHPLVGHVASSRLVEAVDGPVDQASGLQNVHDEVEIVYPLESTDPLTISFDVLADKGSPAAAWQVLYSLDVHGPRNRHADLAQNMPFVFDVVEASAPPAGRGAPRADAAPGRRRGRVGSSAVGAGIFIALLGIAYSFLKRKKRF